MDPCSKSEFDPFSTDNNGKSDVPVISTSFDPTLPYDILEKIFSFLPIESIIRAGSVCKSWKQVVHSGKSSWIRMPTQKPWYFMFTCSRTINGFAYDHTFRKWYTFDFPCLNKSNYIVSSSSGLVCFMDFENRDRIFICNPITRAWKQLQQPPDVKSPDYCALSFSVNKFSLSYTVAIVKSKQMPHDYLQWEFAIQIYKSQNREWVAAANMVLVGWRGGEESVICDGILYCLAYSSYGNDHPRHGLIIYDLQTDSVMRPIINVPFPLTCGRLMNLRDRVVMVGGVGRYDRPGTIKGIGIWELCGEEWREVGRMPQKFLRGFGELDDVFKSSGMEDLIFIQSYGSSLLLVFSMSDRQWRWSVRFPVVKRSALQLFTGFCFEPRLEIPV